MPRIQGRPQADRENAGRFGVRPLERLNFNFFWERYHANIRHAESFLRNVDSARLPRDCNVAIKNLRACRDRLPGLGQSVPEPMKLHYGKGTDDLIALLKNLAIELSRNPVKGQALPFPTALPGGGYVMNPVAVHNGCLIGYKYY